MDVLENPRIYKSGSNDIVEINNSPFTIGRGLTCDYIIPHKVVSREHCSFEKIDGQWFLRDNSTNGTYVNHHLIKSALGPPLKDHDVIQLGLEQDFKYTFALTSREEISDEQLCIIADSVLENIELAASEAGPSTSDSIVLVTTPSPEPHSVPGEPEPPVKRRKTSRPQRLNNVIDLTEDPDVPSTSNSLSNSVIDISNSFQVVPNATSELKMVIQKVSNTKDSNIPKNETVVSEPSTSNIKSEQSQEKTQKDDKDDFDDELLCAICSELFVKATTLNCSHTFCKMCIETWKSKQSACPICRAKITSLVPTLVLDNFIEKQVLNSRKSVQDNRKELLEERKEIDKKNLPGSAGAPIEIGSPQVLTDDDVEVEEEEEEDLLSSEPSYESDVSNEDYWNDDWYNNQSRGPYYGGYGRCYVCQRTGHWANSCPYR